MYRFVSTYMTKVCETSSTFSHNLHIWYYDILPNLIIFRLCLLFLKFLENSEMGCLPSAHPLALGKHLFAECQPLGTRQTTLFAECLFFAECFFLDTWQIDCLPSVRKIALGKLFGTRWTTVFKHISNIAIFIGEWTMKTDLFWFRRPINFKYHFLQFRIPQSISDLFHFHCER